MLTIADMIAATAQAEAQEARENHSFLYYGPPKTGKTRLIATIAKAPEYQRVFWFDLENGAATIATMVKEGVLTLAEASKIILIRIPDTREDPNAIATLLRTIASKAAANVCDNHGVVDCVECKKEGRGFLTFQLSKLTGRDAVVIDSLSQLGVSAMNLACKGKPVTFIPTWDEYAIQGKYLSDILTIVQAAKYCSFHCVTHVELIKDDDGSDKYFPQCGTRNFSTNTAKYFGTVVFLEKKLGKHKASSGSLSNVKTLAGSRLGILLESQKEMDLVASLREAGFLPAIQADEVDVVESVTAAAVPTKPTGRFGSTK